MNKDEKIKILRDLIKINSVNGNEAKVTKYLVKILKDKNIKAHADYFDEDSANLIADIGVGNGPVLCFEGHQDTVAIGDERKWKHNPFEAEVVGDNIYGRGAADMKSGLAAAVIAMIELNEDLEKIPGRIRLVATSGEEFGAKGAYRLTDSDVLDDVSAMVVGEPTGGKLIHAHSGSLNYRIKSFGKSVHSSIPERGTNAIIGLNYFINAERKIFENSPVDSILGEFKHSITTIKGGSQVNIIPDYAELYGNIRPTMALSNQKVKDMLAKAILDLNEEHKLKLELEIVHDFFPMSTPSESIFVKQVLKAARENFGSKSQLGIINGATDASVYVQKYPTLPVVVLGPDTWEIAHQANEMTSIKSYMNTIETYKEIARSFF
ncbi:ArgE/DapE family deacylase [Liquorilactobacillus mali]|uniref:Probable succinyl-diaminopimelate desuccinylase n=1 Tax=Liquorilactobacillus mali TaxID=1618 RepID=A0A0R2FQ55_9LACO|nr:ArgE/DapE family deacylase [Liquorilactobacillus mali]KRN30254.1 succinyl-diaminopimelate desuccinylase [Liquorilactobacillus mali]MDN7146604.1 ArgE/DapE family deacylase [Liquorilactobacillus mali]